MNNNNYDDLHSEYDMDILASLFWLFSYFLFYFYSDC
jgi:hypothetical protein